jgi:hypothetical protein
MHHWWRLFLRLALIREWHEPTLSNFLRNFLAGIPLVLIILKHILEHPTYGVTNKRFALITVPYDIKPVLNFPVENDAGVGAVDLVGG